MELRGISLNKIIESAFEKYSLSRGHNLWSLILIYGILRQIWRFFRIVAPILEPYTNISVPELSAV